MDSTQVDHPLPTERLSFPILLFFCGTVYSEQGLTNDSTAVNTSRLTPPHVSKAK
jgi:hypothetical protein